MTVDPLEMDLTADTGGIKERDLSRALSNARAKDGGRPLEVVKYDLPIKDRLELRERGGDLDENFALDFPIQFARDFVAHVQPGKRPDQVRQAKQFIADTRQRRARQGRRGAQGARRRLERRAGRRAAVADARRRRRRRGEGRDRPRRTTRSRPATR